MSIVALCYGGIGWMLAEHVNGMPDGYADLIRLTPKSAHITIGLA